MSDFVLIILITFVFFLLIIFAFIAIAIYEDNKILGISFRKKCKWHYIQEDDHDSIKIVMSCTDAVITTPNNNLHDFKYCPYCGGKIKGLIHTFESNEGAEENNNEDSEETQNER